MTPVFEKITCEHCHFVAESWKALSAHMLVHPESWPTASGTTAARKSGAGAAPTTTRFTCAVCSYTTENRWRHNQHARTHTNKRSCKCPLCASMRAYVVRSHCSAHDAAHTAAPSAKRAFKPMASPHCDFVAHSLDEHMNVHSTEVGEVRVVCEMVDDELTLTLDNDADVSRALHNNWNVEIQRNIIGLSKMAPSCVNNRKVRWVHC